MNSKEIVAIGLGGNIGETEVLFEKAVNMLHKSWLTDIKLSAQCVTPAMNCVPGTPDFLNCVLTGVWKNSAEMLLKVCQDIEIKLGRPEKHSSMEARTIDLDILLFGNRIINTDSLIVPHPRMRERIFVMAPLKQLMPDFILPGSQDTVSAVTADLLKNTNDSDFFWLK